MGTDVILCLTSPTTWMKAYVVRDGKVETIANLTNLNGDLEETLAALLQLGVEYGVSHIDIQGAEDYAFNIMQKTQHMIIQDQKYASIPFVITMNECNK